MKEKIVQTHIETPIGTAEIKGTSKGIISIKVLDKKLASFENTPDVLKNCVKQLKEYFEGSRKTFSIQLNPEGTEFQKKVWNNLTKIPWGKTKTYLEQSKDYGDPKAIRAIASANGKNPIWIVIPCHRVIGSNGSLTGYAGGIWRKKWLLNHESEYKQQSLFS